ncbi:FMN-dependent NADH-azoreductase [Acidomonas methanolica]|uniref:FMN-dependent NADH-azoreductase n=1 Tax=Acidomonas methanolica TaxID=437 RepID=UPI00211A0E68|nr:FMN-dependent NADH-azoreductase [Acidomonas methanolica]MCQ9156261.1 FMN-dependent NADH-azoreductase [Acidomonas methanolica]
MTLLHIDSSILGDNSASRQITADTVAHLRAADPGVTIVYRDLAANPLPHLSGGYLARQSPDVQHDPALQADLHHSGRVLDEFLAADTVVIGAPMYNFTIPSQLKAWIDRICVAGKTFRHYTEDGFEGLVGGKKIILAITRGGLYGPDSPSASFEHQERYLRAVFTFLGVTDITTIIAEGLAGGEEQRKAALADTKAQIARL